MDIWAWTYTKKRELRESGYSRLAQIMDDLPHFTCEDQHARASTLFHEGLALARSREDKWVELFLRHWNLQSQVLSQCNGLLLPEAIDLLDFSHQEETRECPQRICVVQDLAASYGIQDGPAYYQERVSVCDETLAEINATWPCYGCVATELINAYLDVNDYSSALRRAEQCADELVAANQSTDSFAFMRARALLGLDRPQEALGILKYAREPGGGERFKRERKQLLSLTYIALEDWVKAKRQLLNYQDALSAQAYFVEWVEIRYQLFRAGKFPVEESLLLEMLEMATRLSDFRANRDALFVFGRITELATAVQNHLLAEVGLTNFKKHVLRLVKDLGASDELSRLSMAVEALQSPPPLLDQSLSLDAFFELDFASGNQEVHAYLEAIVRWPNEPQIIIGLAQLYQRYQLPEKARCLLLEGRKRISDNGPLEYHFGQYLLQNEGPDVFKSTCPLNNVELPEDVRVARLWSYVDLATASDPRNALSFVEQILKIRPGMEAALNRKAHLQEELLQYDAAIDTWTLLIESEPEEKYYHWRRLVPASIQKNWVLVKTSAEAIGMNLDDQLPINAQHMEVVRIEFVDESGESQHYFARRTGPVIAMITEVVHQDRLQRLGTEVVFDPSPLNDLNQVDDEGHPCDLEGYYHHTYRCFHVVNAPMYLLYILDGVHPGEELLGCLKASLAEGSVVFSQRNNEEYEIEPDPDVAGGKGIKFPGVYAYLLIPKDGDLSWVDKCLAEFSQNLEHPLVWPGLLEALGDADGLERQAAISARYGL